MSTDITQIVAESSTIAIGFTLLSLAFTLVITLLVMRFVRKALGQDRSIIQNGIPARAKILSVRQERTRSASSRASQQRLKRNFSPR